MFNDNKEFSQIPLPIIEEQNIIVLQQATRMNINEQENTENKCIKSDLRRQRNYNHPLYNYSGMNNTSDARGDIDTLLTKEELLAYKTKMRKKAKKALSIRNMYDSQLDDDLDHAWWNDQYREIDQTFALENQNNNDHLRILEEEAFILAEERNNLTKDRKAIADQEFNDCSCSFFYESICHVEWKERMKVQVKDFFKKVKNWIQNRLWAVFIIGFIFSYTLEIIIRTLVVFIRAKSSFSDSTKEVFLFQNRKPTIENNSMHTTVNKNINLTTLKVTNVTNINNKVTKRMKRITERYLYDEPKYNRKCPIQDPCHSLKTDKEVDMCFNHLITLRYKWKDIKDSNGYNLNTYDFNLVDKLEYRNDADDYNQILMCEYPQKLKSDDWKEYGYLDGDLGCANPSTTEDLLVPDIIKTIDIDKE